MIGRLVEQQQVRLLKKKFGERDAHLPAAGEFISQPIPIVAMKAQPRKHLANFRFERVTIARAEFMFEFLITVGDIGIGCAGVVQLRHAASKRLHLFFHRMQPRKHRHALRKNRLAAQRETILRQVTGGNTLGARDRAIVKGFQARQNFHDGRFTGAVGADQTNARLRRDQPVGVFEEKFVAIALARAGKLDHGISSYLNTKDTEGLKRNSILQHCSQGSIDHG